jgi:hypothetical protein
MDNGGMGGLRANQFSQWEWQHTEQQSCVAAVGVVRVGGGVGVIVGPRHICVRCGCLVCLVVVVSANRDG